MVEATERNDEAVPASAADVADSPRAELASLVSGLPRRADAAHALAQGRPGLAIAERVEALGADDLAELDDDTLLRAGAALLAHDRGELAARCFAALEAREPVAGLARLGLAWVSWAAGEAEACAEGLKAAAQLDPTAALVPAGTELRRVRARAGAIAVLAASDDEGEHDVERIILPRPLLAAERRALQAAAERLAKLSHPAVAGYGVLALERDGARLRREPVPGKPLSASLDQPRSLDDALAIVGPLADGLVAAHEQGVVHGAIHPSLVTLAPAGAVLRAFGLHTLEAPSPGDAAEGFVAPERRGGG